MTHDKDKILLRAKDISLLVLVLTLFGMLLGPLKKTFIWDQTASKVEKLEDKMNAQSSDMAVIKSQYSDISKQLDSIQWQLRRLNNGGR